MELPSPKNESIALTCCSNCDKGFNVETKSPFKPIILENFEDGFRIEYDTFVYPKMSLDDTRFNFKVKVEEHDPKKLPKDHVPPPYMRKNTNEIGTFSRWEPVNDPNDCKCELCDGAINKIMKNSPTSITMRGIDDRSDMALKGEFHKLDISTYTKSIIVENEYNNNFFQKKEQDGIISIEVKNI